MPINRRSFHQLIKQILLELKFKGQRFMRQPTDVVSDSFFLNYCQSEIIVELCKVVCLNRLFVIRIQYSPMEFNVSIHER